jgi:pimeloyl-ACP methyl ester carboxylesterase
MAPTNRIQLTSGALHVESNGDPLGRLILCVHGLSANCRSLDRFVPVLAEAGHHVVTMDLRGRGRSEITPPRFLRLGQPRPRSPGDRRTLRGRFVRHDRAFDGWFIGLSLAAQYPRRCSRLVLIDAVGEPEPSALPTITKSVSRLGRIYPSTAAVLSYMRAAGTPNGSSPRPATPRWLTSTPLTTPS